MAASVAGPQGKTGFVKEHLNDHPTDNPTSVNAAWKAAGMAGSVSPSLVNKVRAELGLTGNIRRGKKPKAQNTRAARSPRAMGTRSNRGRPATVESTDRAPTRASTGGRARRIVEFEADLDRLLFQVMSIGELPGVEESLRETRRTLYRHLHGQND